MKTLLFGIMQGMMAGVLLFTGAIIGALAGHIINGSFSRLLTELSQLLN